MDEKKYKDQMESVPFGSSIFQIQHFVADQITPERSRRHVLLQLDAKLKAMNECRFRRRRKEIDIEEISEKLLSASGREKRRLEIDLEEAQYYLESEIKLINDAIIEIQAYEKILDALPEFTREEFEVAELGYWKQRLIKQGDTEFISGGTIGVGTLQSLEQIGLILNRNEQGKFIVIEDKSNNLIESEQKKSEPI